MAIYDIVGFIGSMIIVALYFGNQQGWIRPEQWQYPFFNLVGAVLILISLYWAWNFPSVVIEGFWAVISIYGLVKALRAGRSSSAASLPG